MKGRKILSGLLVALMVFTSIPVSVFAEEATTGVWTIGETQYASLQEAVTNAAEMQSDEIVTIVLEGGNATGAGVVIPSEANIAIDFGGFTYTVNDAPLTGSVGTQTQALQIIKGANVILTNGTLSAEEPVKVLVQNYADLQVIDVTLDGTKSDDMVYVSSNNCGKIEFIESSILANEGITALDVYYWPSYNYNNVNVTVTDTTIVGNIEYGSEVSEGFAENATLEIVSGDLSNATFATYGEGVTLGNANILVADGVDHTATYDFSVDGEVIVEPTCSDEGVQVYNCIFCAGEVVGHVTEASVAINPEAHEYEYTVLKEATCTAPGIQKVACALCDLDAKYTSIPAAHAFKEANIIDLVEATCVDDGYYTYVCAVCEEEKTVTIPATEKHNFKQTTLDATCQSGALVGKACTVCGLPEGEMEAVEGSEAVDHNWVLDTEDERYKEVTCEENGVSVYKCSWCEEEKIETVETKGHTWNKNETHVEAGCENPAGVEKICDVCETVELVPYTGELAQEALGHEYIYTTVNASCEVGEYVITTCERCDFEEKSEPGEADENAHVPVLDVVLKEATCETTGVGKYVCELCEESLGYKVIPSGHVLLEENIIDLVEATCVDAGEATYVCNTCGEEVAVEIPATGVHTAIPGYVDATCTEPAKAGDVCEVCGAAVGETEIVEGSVALGHDYVVNTELENYEAPACEEEGFGTLECTRCDAVLEDQTLPALGHNYVEGGFIEASCEYGAGIESVCEQCGDVIVDEIIDEETGEVMEPALGHTPKKVEDVAPTCETTGLEGKVICSVCEAVLEEGREVPVDENAHEAVLVATLKEATCETTGIGKYACGLCEQELGYKVIASGHVFNEENIVDLVEPTCVEDGELTYVCSECGEEVVEVIPATEEHDIVEGLIEATCDEPAMIGWSCTICGEKFGDVEIVEGSEPLGHEMVVNTELEDYVAPTCEEDGVGTLECIRCDEVLKDQVLPALEHNYVEGGYVEASCEYGAGVEFVCEICGASYVEEFTEEDLVEPALGHKYEVEEVPATCVEGGYTITTCENCDYYHESEKGEVDGNAHDAVLIATLKEATCETTGIGKYECGLCEEELGYKVIAAGHAFEEENIVDLVEPTCVKDGEVTYVCATCGEEVTEEIAATGEHDFQDGYIDATCEEPAKAGSICTVCGETDGETVDVADSEALGHDLVVNTELENYVAAECDKAGFGTFECTRCDYKVDKEIPALEHDWKYVTEVEASCEDPAGVKEECTICDATRVVPFADENGVIEKPALGHKHVVEEVSATCQEGGYTIITCENCDLYEESEPGEPDADAHSAVLDTILKEATCESTGIGKYVCELCEENLGYKVIPSGHVFDEANITELVEATCGKDGKVTYVCSACEEEVEEVIPATGEHNFENGYTDATCEEPAKAGIVCTVCGETDGEVEYVDGSEALGHDLVVDTENEDYVAATCEKGGYDTLVCTRCDYTEEKVTKALGHTWDDGKHVEAGCENPAGVMQTCQTCGATQTEAYEGELAEEAFGHDYEAVVTEPTCAEGGYTTYTCVNCGDEYVDDETEATEDGHVAELVNTLKEATCTSTGIGKYACEICGTDMGYKTIAKLDHTFGENYVNAAGTAVYHNCTVCGEEEKVADIVEDEDCADGSHVAGEAVKENEVAPTCTEAGTYDEVVYCTICNAVLSSTPKTIEALGHSEVEIPAVAATCSKTGLTVGAKCETCGTITVAQEVVAMLPHNFIETPGFDEAGNAYVDYTCKDCGYNYVEK